MVAHKCRHLLNSFKLFAFIYLFNVPLNVLLIAPFLFFRISPFQFLQQKSKQSKVFFVRK